MEFLLALDFSLAQSRLLRPFGKESSQPHGPSLLTPLSVALPTPDNEI